MKNTTAFDELSAENQKLRDAIQAQTIELEWKNRELEIEAALERIRARALAMHKSPEIKDVAAAMRNELLGLGLQGVSAATIWLEQPNGKIRAWDFTIVENSSLDKDVQVDVEFDPKDAPPRAHFHKIWNRQGNYWVGESDLEDLYESVNWLKTQDEEAAAEMLRLLDNGELKYWWHPTTVLEKGRLNVDFVVPPPEEMATLLPKMAAVFDLAYRRFEDLQKAEEQTREAQIEAALERVRAKTMTMHKSDELRAVSGVVFEQLVKLGFDIPLCGFIIYDKKNGDSTQLLSGFGSDIFPHSYHVPYHDHPYLIAQLNAWKEGVPIKSFVWEGELKKSVDEFFFEKTDFKKMPPEMQESFKGIESIILYNAFMSHGCLEINTAEPITKEQESILQRFAIVFDQTYTRFLDLQKAEQQAREAQIETALERVRSRTMAMHKTDELRSVIHTVFEQVKTLGFDATACALTLFNKADKSMVIWFAGFDTDSYPDSHYVPYFDHPMYKAQFGAWEKGQTYQVFKFEGELKKSYDELIFELGDFKHLPSSAKEAILSIETATNCTAFMKYGMFESVMIGDEVLTNQQADTLQRFAKVFEQTYTRFLDLQKAEEQARKIKLVNQENERLLHSILPQPIAEQIRSGQPNVVKRFEQVSILFADIVGFTVLSEKLEPGKVVDILNGLFSRFDDLTDAYGLEKIKTIGDAYMVAAGVPDENADHARVIFRFAQDMLRSLEEYNQSRSSQLNLRIGISSGPVVAGVIGKKKFAYDLWGDSVNTAARMEAYGREGKIQVSPSSYALLKNDFAFEKLPGVNIKGKGVMDVYIWKPQSPAAFPIK